MTRTRVAQVASLACAHHIPCVISMRSCFVFDSFRLLQFSLFAVYLLSYRPVFPPSHQLHLPRCGGQIPCALQLMRTLALLPSTTLSQVLSPTTTTSHRLLNRTSRSPPECSLSGTHHLQCRHRRGLKTTALTQNEEYCPVAIYNPLTGSEPKLLDNFDYSETSAMIFQDESGDIDTEPSYSCDAELDDEIVGKCYLHHSSFRSEKNQRTGDKLITLMKKVCCQLSPFSHTQERERPVHEPSSCSTSQTSNAKEISWNDSSFRQCWFYFLKREFFSSGSFVVHL